MVSFTSNHQAYSIEAGLKTMDDYAESQIVRFGEGHVQEGQLIVDSNGKPQYRQVFYSNTPKEDVELRTEIAEDFYASASIKASFIGVFPPLYPIARISAATVA